MDDMIRVLIADGDQHARNTACTMLMQRDFAAYSAKDGQEALNFIQRLLPDAVILSLALPIRDGISVIEALGKCPMKRYPYIIVLTSMPAHICSRATALGADFIMRKPADTAALEKLLRAQARATLPTLARRQAEQRIPAVVQQLGEIGMPAHLKGFEYLAKAVAAVSVDDQLLRQATGKLYPGIAAEYGVSDHSVERAIRHAIETTWTHGRVEALHEVFGNSIDPQRGKPTNTECIAMLAEHLWKRIPNQSQY